MSSSFTDIINLEANDSFYFVWAVTAGRIGYAKQSAVTSLIAIYSQSASYSCQAFHDKVVVNL